jgi:hypothetical protein
LVTLRSGVLPRWVGAVALIGAVGFSIAFLTTLDGTADGSVFGYGFFPGIVALVTWSVATSITRYRAIGRGGDVTRSWGGPPVVVRDPLTR